MSTNTLCILRGAAYWVGRLPNLGRHANVSATAVVGLDGPVRKRIEGRDQELSGRAFVFDGSLPQETYFAGPVGILFADPGSEIGERLVRDAGPARVAADPPWTDDFLATGQAVYSAAPNADLAQILARGYPFQLLEPIAALREDERLSRVVAELRAQPDAALEVERLAALIGMSPSWLQHAFRKRTGLPLRAYRKWFQMKAAVVALKDGAALADAALGAGFYDQAHFTNAFRDIFGVTPAAVFGRGEAIRWQIEEELP